MDKRKGLRNGLLLSLVVIFSFVLGVISPFELKHKQNESMDLFEEIYQVLSDHWYYGDDEEMINRAINALYTQEDDPFTFILGKNTSVMDTVSGKGIGISISDYGGYLYIEEVFNGANRTNLRKGDIIISVNGTSLDNMTYSESSGLLAQATSNDTLSVKLLRDGVEVEVDLVVSKYSDDITVNLIEENEDYLSLQIREFGSYTGSEFGKFLEDYSDAKNLIIDLRGNPGGYITSVINVASYLLPNKTPVMSVMDRDGNSTTYVTSNSSHYTFDHIYILIDDDSASGAEALTLCLMDNAQNIEELDVTVLGQTSYGKGTAQQDYILSNGYSIHCTYAKWYSPAGTNINNVGVSPTSGFVLDFIDYEKYYYTYTLLNFEDQNNSVLALQYQLLMLGYENVRTHGYFDELTVDAVKSFQTNNYLEATGEVDLTTYNLIKRNLVDLRLSQSKAEYDYTVSLIGE